MQVLNNTPAFNVWKNYSENVSSLRQSMSKLSSGLKIQTASDDPAGLAISQRLRLQSSNSAAAEQNIQNALSFSQTADSWLQKVHDILGRMGELSVSAADGTKSTTDIDNLQTEYDQMSNELDRITADSTYNTKPLFGGSDLSIQIGPDDGQTFTLTAMDVGTAVGSLTATVEAGDAVNQVNLATDAVSGIRADLGAQSSRLKIVLAGLTAYESNVRGAESQVRDVDMAKEATSFSKFSILTQVGVSMMSQANALPQSVLKLIG